jgi:hypothetical protein
MCSKMRPCWARACALAPAVVAVEEGVEARVSVLVTSAPARDRRCRRLSIDRQFGHHRAPAGFLGVTAQHIQVANGTSLFRWDARDDQPADDLLAPPRTADRWCYHVLLQRPTGDPVSHRSILVEIEVARPRPRSRGGRHGAARQVLSCSPPGGASRLVVDNADAGAIDADDERSSERLSRSSPRERPGAQAIIPIRGARGKPGCVAPVVLAAFTPAQRRWLSANQKAVNSAHARLRGPGERANTQLKSWKSFARSAPANPPDPTRQRCLDPHPRTLNPSGRGSLTPLLEVRQENAAGHADPSERPARRHSPRLIGTPRNTCPEHAHAVLPKLTSPSSLSHRVSRLGHGQESPGHPAPGGG